MSAGSHMQRYIGDIANNIQSIEGLAAGDPSIKQNIACSFDANDTYAEAKALVTAAMAKGDSAFPESGNIRYRLKKPA